MHDRTGQPMPRSGDDPIDVVLLALRSNLISLETGDDVARHLDRVFARANLSNMNAAMQRLARLIFSARNIALELHHPRCPCLAPFEQLFIASLRRLQRGDIEGYEQSMGALVQGSAVSLAIFDMELVADDLERMEHTVSTPERNHGANVVNLQDYASSKVH